MAAPIPVGYGLAVIQHSQPFSGQTQIVTFNFQDNTVALTPNEVADLIAASWTGTGNPFVASLVADSAQFDSVKVYIQTEPGLLLGEAIQTIAGTRSSQPPSPQVAMVVKKKTAFVGRRHRGRFYIPASFLVATDVGPSGSIGATPLGVLQARFDTFLGNLSNDDVPMVICHVEAPFTPDEVTSLTCEQLIGTQRRRVR